jgi:hypothetical protein
MAADIVLSGGGGGGKGMVTGVVRMGRTAAKLAPTTRL